MKDGLVFRKATDNAPPTGAGGAQTEVYSEMDVLRMDDLAAAKEAEAIMLQQGEVGIKHAPHPPGTPCIPRDTPHPPGTPRIAQAHPASPKHTPHPAGKPRIAQAHPASPKRVSETQGPGIWMAPGPWAVRARLPCVRSRPQGEVATYFALFLLARVNFVVNSRKATLKPHSNPTQTPLKPHSNPLSTPHSALRQGVLRSAGACVLRRPVLQSDGGRPRRLRCGAGPRARRAEMTSGSEWRPRDSERERNPP